jgi:hypothetical protein
MPYTPLEDYVTTDDDRSSRRIRDMPYGKRRFSLSVHPAELIFELTEVGETSAAQTILLVNNGYDSLTITGTTVVGDFEIVGDVPEELAPAEIASIQIAFSPLVSAEAITGGLYIQTGDAAGEEFIPLSGSSDGSDSGVADFLMAENLDTGTENSLFTTTRFPVPEGDIAVPIGINILEANTGSVEVVFNEDDPLTIVDADGEPLEAGDLEANTLIIGYKLGDTFQLYGTPTPDIDLSGYQPLDNDLTLISALVTQEFGRSLLTLNNLTELQDLLDLETLITNLIEQPLPLVLATAADVRSAATGDKLMTSELMETASAFVALTDAATVALNWNSGINFTLAIAGNRTLGNPTNGQPGTWRHIVVTQGSGGSHTLAYGGQYKFEGGTAPVLSTVEGAVDILAILCLTSTSFFVASANDVQA